MIFMQQFDLFIIMLFENCLTVSLNTLEFFFVLVDDILSGCIYVYSLLSFWHHFCT